MSSNRTSNSAPLPLRNGNYYLDFEIDSGEAQYLLSYFDALLHSPPL
jgi:hypothetical protein